MGRRVQYRVILEYRVLGDPERLYRTAFVSSPGALTKAQVLDAAFGQGRSLLSESPGAAGKDSDMLSYGLVGDIVSVWRSH